MAAHLLECAQCRAEVDELRRTVELARADGVGEPLPIPPTRVWQAILDELAEDPARAGTPDRDGHAPAVRPVVDDPEEPDPAGDTVRRRRWRRTACAPRGGGARPSASRRRPSSASGSGSASA